MNKGFKSLPEYVQRKIDPEMAKRYMGGGAVMDRPLFRQAGGPAQPNMQEMAAMGQQYLMQPEQQMAPQQVDPQQAAMVQGAEQDAMMQGEQIGAMIAQSTMDNIDAAEDPKSMIDALRGNEKPLEERYAELAGYVGEEDANKTPESVLAMVQPTIMMTEEGAVDSGIGELMQQLVAGVDMSEGEAMGQGVGELMAMGAGNTPPANFNQGGAVRRFAPGGAVASDAAAYMPQFQELYASVLGDPATRQAELDEQKRLTQAQMLFDIAQTGLQFAGTTEGRSIAERLANAASATQLFPRIGERAAGQLAAKQAVEKEKRQMDLAALQSSIGVAQQKAQDDAAMARAKATITPPKPVKLGVNEILYSADGKELARGTVQGEIVTLGEGEIAYDADGKEIAKGPAKTKTYTLGPGQVLLDGDGKVLHSIPDTYQLPPGSVVKDADGKTIARGDPKPPVTHLLGPNQRLLDGNGKVLAEGKEVKQTVTVGPGQEVIDVETKTVITKGPPKFETVTFYKTSEEGVLSKAVNVSTAAGIEAADKLMLQGYVPDNMEAKAFIEQQMQPVKGIPRDIFNTLPEDVKTSIAQGDVNGVPMHIFNTLSEDEQKKLMNIVPVVPDSYSSKLVDTADGPTLVVMNDRTGQEVSAKTYDPVASGALIKFSITNPDGSLTETVELLGSKAGKELQAKVNAANKSKPGSANMMKVGTESVNPQAYLTKEGQVITSFDNRTFTDSAGNVKLLTDVEARSLGEANVYEIIKSQNIQNYAKERVKQRQQQLGNITFVDENGDPLDAELQTQLRNFMSTTLQELTVSEQDVRKGTGLASNALAIFNAVGGTFFPETANRIFKNNAQARKNLELFNFVAVSAMARNPRYAVYDMQQVKGNLVNPKNLLANTATEADKFQSLVALMTQERNDLEDAISRGDKAVMDDVSSALKKIREIDFVLSLVRINPDRRQGSLTEALSATDEFE